jgi:hypothetical protein
MKNIRWGWILLGGFVALKRATANAVSNARLA